MKSHLLKLAARFDALQVRERWLVAIAVLGGIVLIGTPCLSRRRSRARGWPSGAWVSSRRNSRR